MSHNTMSKLEPHWQPLDKIKAEVSSIFLDWLSYHGSMTERLRQYCKKVNILVLNQNWTQPFLSESLHLGLKQDELAFIREVKIICDEQVWLFARSVIPSKTLNGQGAVLTKLGTNSMADVLFKHALMRRGNFEIAAINADHYFFHVASENLKAQPLWARRSNFYLNEEPLLINEVFTEVMRKNIEGNLQRIKIHDLVS